MRFFGLKTCDTCRKALRDIRGAGRDVEVIDVRADGVADTDLDAMVAAFGDAVINRSSATWRGLDAGARALPARELIARHPTLIKRPVIEADGQWFQGWRPATAAAVLERGA